MRQGKNDQLDTEQRNICKPYDFLSRSLSSLSSLQLSALLAFLFISPSVGQIVIRQKSKEKTYRKNDLYSSKEDGYCE